MKRIILMRHAEAENFHDSGDFFRKLTDVGERQALQAARFASKYNIEKIILSPAIRTKQTLNIILKELKVDNIEESAELYERALVDIINLIKIQDNVIDSLFFIGHNPTIYELALKFTNNNKALLNFKMMPASIITITFNDLTSWKNLEEDRGKIEDIFNL